MRTNSQFLADTSLIDSRIGRSDSNTFQNQGDPINDDEIEDDLNEEEELNDEPLDEEGDPTGEHDHHQDDNYALGGHVTRSGGV